MAYFIIHKNCNTCRSCLPVCMSNAIVDLHDELYINPAWCTECGTCAAMCYEDAIGYEGLDLVTENFLHENTEDISWHLLVNSGVDDHLIPV